MEHGPAGVVRDRAGTTGDRAACRMHLIATMDPTASRGETSAVRPRTAQLWKILGGAAGALALTFLIVDSCLDRGEARLDAEEPSYVETTAAMTRAAGAAEPGATTPASLPATMRASTRDSSGGIAPTTTISSAPMTMRRRERSYTPVPVPFERANGDSSTSGTAGTTDAGNVHSAGPNDAVINPPTDDATDPTSVLIDASPNAGHASHANNDPNNRPAPSPFGTARSTPAR